MDKEKARLVLAEQLRHYRSKSYETLTGSIGKIDAFEIAAPDGTEYQIEIEVRWDREPHGNILVAGSIDDGRWSAFNPQTDSFILTPEGKFAGQ